jgi:hypothetical protein
MPAVWCSGRVLTISAISGDIMKTNQAPRRIAASIVAAVLAAGNLAFMRPVLAHEAPCPYCAQVITQDTDTQDNEVVLKFGRKRVEYKCVFF